MRGRRTFRVLVRRQFLLVWTDWFIFLMKLVCVQRFQAYRSTWLITSRCWQIKLEQRRRKQSAWKLLIMRGKWEASWVSKGGFVLQILRKSDCQQITLHRIPTIPPYGDAGDLWLQVRMKRWRGEEMHNWCTLEFGPEWWQTGSTCMQQYQNPPGPVCSVVRYTGNYKRSKLHRFQA